MNRLLLSLVIVIATSAAAPAQPVAAPTSTKPRHIYVLHDGLHSILSPRDPVWATKIMRRCLRDQGVPERDIIVMDYPFPISSWDSWEDMFPRGALTYYVASTKPDSEPMQQAYLRLHRALVDRGVRPEDKLIWIGHSAGGQVGMSMAHLGGCLSKYPELAQKSAAHPFDMVVTLGSPLSVDRVPASVKQRHYYSPDDPVVRLAWRVGPLALMLLGYDPPAILPTPPRLNDNTIVRIFDGYKHPDWPDERIIARIIAEQNAEQRPSWRSATLCPSAGPGLSRLLCEALEETCRLSIEDPFE